MQSLTAKTDSLSLLSQQSLFTSQELPVKHHGTLLVKPRGYDGLLTLILFLAFTLFVIVKVYSPRKLNQMFLAFIKPVAMNQLMREEYTFSNRSSILLLLLATLILPLFAFQVIGFSGSVSFLHQYVLEKGLKAYVIFTLFALGAYLVKILTIKFLALTFSVKGAGAEYVYTILLFNKVAGIVMFPLVLLIAFAHQLSTGLPLYTGITILAILLVYRMLRLVQIGISTSGVSPLYLFLYLCTLEILPFVVLIKLFMFSFS